MVLRSQIQVGKNRMERHFGGTENTLLGARSLDLHLFALMSPYHTGVLPCAHLPWPSPVLLCGKMGLNQYDYTQNVNHF